MGNPPQSRSRQKELVEGEWTVVWSDQSPSVCFRRLRVSDQLYLIGLAKGCFVRNSVHLSGGTKHTYASQGQALETEQRYPADSKQCDGKCSDINIVSLLE